MSGRYELLRQHLAGSGLGTIRMTFRQIERVLGFPLPPSARRHQAWWANDPRHTQAKAWLDVGRRSGALSIPGETVVFSPRAGPTENNQNHGFEEGPPAMVYPTLARHPAIGAMKGMITVMPGVDLTAPVNPEWVERLHAENATASDLVGGVDDPDSGAR